MVLVRFQVSVGIRMLLQSLLKNKRENYDQTYEQAIVEQLELSCKSEATRSSDEWRHVHNPEWTNSTLYHLYDLTRSTLILRRAVELWCLRSEQVYDKSSRLYEYVYILIGFMSGHSQTT